MKKRKMKLMLLSTKTGHSAWELRDRELIISSAKGYCTAHFAVRSAERNAEKMNIEVIKSKYNV